MLFKRNKKPVKYDNDVLLRANIAQAIKILYLDRKYLFSNESKEYDKLNQVLINIMNNIEKLKEKHAKMMIPDGKQFKYMGLNNKLLQELKEYFEFLLDLPPPGYHIFARWKKSADIGMMHVPTLTYILYSLLDYKLPKSDPKRINRYTSIFAAIVEILQESSYNQNLIESADKIKDKIQDKVDKELEETFKEKIVEWMRLGLLI